MNDVKRYLIKIESTIGLFG